MSAPDAPTCFPVAAAGRVVAVALDEDLGASTRRHDARDDPGRPEPRPQFVAREAGSWPG